MNGGKLELSLSSRVAMIAAFTDIRTIIIHKLIIHKPCLPYEPASYVIMCLTGPKLKEQKAPSDCPSPGRGKRGPLRKSETTRLQDTSRKGIIYHIIIIQSPELHRARVHMTYVTRVT